MLLLELLQPAGRQVRDYGVLEVAPAGEELGLLHDLVVRQPEAALLLSLDVIAERAIEIGKLLALFVFGSSVVGVSSAAAIIAVAVAGFVCISLEVLVPISQHF